MPRHIRKGDTVIITAGNDRGATGEVLRVLAKENRVVVQGVNVRAKHLKPTQANPQGGIVRREMPIHISNVSPVVGGKPTRVRWMSKPDGSKVRVAVRSGKELHTLHGPRKKQAGSKPAPKGKAPARTPTKTKTKTRTRTRKTAGTRTAAKE
jgi:large subunit ribosomal protein L24